MDGIDKTARLLLEARDRRHPVALPLKGPAALDEKSAYAVQDAIGRVLVGERSFRPIGYKIGAINEGSRRTLKAPNPFYGRLFEQMTRPSPAQFGFEEGFFKLYEPEIAVQIDRDLDPASAPFDAAAIRAATRTVLPAIEIVGSRFASLPDAGGANLIADLAVHGWWIRGERCADWSALDLMDGPVSFSIDDEVKARGSGRNVDGGAFGATAWLANALAAAGRGLRAGEYVTTGSTTAPQAVRPGQRVVADFGALGRVELTVT